MSGSTQPARTQPATRRSQSRQAAPAPQPASQTSTFSPRKELDFAGRFLRVFGTHLFGAAKQAGLPENPRGIMFFLTEASKLDEHGTPFRYKSAHLGQAVLLTKEQEDHIIEYLKLGGDPFGARKAPKA